MIFIQKVTHRKNVNKQIKEKRKESDTLNDDSIEDQVLSSPEVFKLEAEWKSDYNNIFKL